MASHRLRITGGEQAGQRLKVPPNPHVRPTGERVREALGSMGTGLWQGAVVLDLFAGSGALGLEAWSRGAERVWWVEENPHVYRVLTQNVRHLCGQAEDPTRTVRSDVLTFLTQVETPPFTIVMADPPYHMQYHGVPVAEKLLQSLAETSIFRSIHWLILEQPRQASPVEAEGWCMTRDRVYGQTRLIRYQPAS